MIPHKNLWFLLFSFTGCNLFTGPHVAEELVPEVETWTLSASKGLAILIMMDDTEETHEVWGYLSNGSKTFYDQVDQPFRIRFVSTYLDEDGSALWMDGGVEIDDEAEWAGAFAHEFDLAFTPAIRHRDVLTPRSRDALRDVLGSDEGQGFVGDDHLVVMLISALHDHSEDTPEQRDVLRERMEAQPWGSTLVMATPLTDRCEHLYSNIREGHDITRALLHESLTADLDLCDRWMTPAVDAVEVASGRQNLLDGELSWPAIDGTVEVFGVAGGSETALPPDQWSVEGAHVRVSPPLRGFDAVRVAYEREVPAK
jgi:hypothetical protein